MGAYKLRRPKESAGSTTGTTEKQDARDPGQLQLMEFAFRMGQSSHAAASAVSPPQPAAPSFPALCDGTIDDPPSASKPTPKIEVAAEVLGFEKKLIMTL